MDFIVLFMLTSNGIFRFGTDYVLAKIILSCSDHVMVRWNLFDGDWVYLKWNFQVGVGSRVDRKYFFVFGSGCGST